MENNETDIDQDNQGLTSNNLFQQNVQPSSAPLPINDNLSPQQTVSQSINASTTSQQNSQFIPEYTAPTTPSGTISQWPGAFGIFKISKEAVMLNLGTIVSTFLILIVFSAFIGLIPKEFSNNIFLNILSSVINMIVSAMLTYMIIESVKGQKVDVGIAFNKIIKKSLNIILASILTTIITIGSIILLIIPAFFIVPRISLTLYFIIDKDMGVIDALGASWDHTKGNLGKIYGIIGVYILACLPIITIIGAIATVYLVTMYSASLAIFYIYVINNNKPISA